MMATFRNARAFPYRVNYLALLIGSALFGMGLLTAAGFYREQQEIASERAVLRTIYSMLALPEETAPNRLYLTLSQYAAEHEEGRRARIARLAGIEPDWTQILQRVGKLSAIRRSEIYSAMAKEYGLPDTWTPADLQQRALMEQSRPGLIPVPQAASRPSAD
ncbi:MAG: hypothetical protein JWL77_3170 [Chthonomonadaceae bacterium]|nr:hypothetical protein [Chthonomonadaceae bacterium]